MKNRQILFLIILIFVLTYGLTGCSTKCDDFNKSVLMWAPYKSGDTVLVSGKNISDTLFVKRVQIYHTDRIKVGATCVCENSYLVSLSSADRQIDLNFTNSGDYKISHILVNNEWFDYSGTKDSLLVMDKIFHEILLYKNRTTYLEGELETVILSKNKGLVVLIGKSDTLVVGSINQAIPALYADAVVKVSCE